EPPGDRTLALESGVVPAARAAGPGPEGTSPQERGAIADAPGADRGHGELPRRTDRDRLPQGHPYTPGPGPPRRALVSRMQGRAGDGGAGPRPGGAVAGRGAGGDRPECHGGVRDSGLLPALECGTGVLRQQAAPRAARPPGLEPVERGACPPDGVV